MRTPPIPPFMQRLLLLTFGVLLAAKAPAALLFHDDFNYTAGENLGELSSVAKWANPKSNITIAQESLNYPGLQATSGNRVGVNGGTSNLDGARTAAGAWPAQTNGSLYISFLLRLNTTNAIGATGNGVPILNISQSASASQQLISVNLLNDSSVKAGVVKYPSGGAAVSSAFFASGPGANLAADASTTCLIVAKYEWIVGAANDIVTLWVNPTTLGAEEDSSNRVWTGAGTDGSGNAGRLYINRGPNLSIDELRIGQTWAEVTPTGETAAPPQPLITDGFFAAEAFVLRGTNGTPSGVYRILNSPDPGSNAWAAIATNRFDPSGHFAVTNEVGSAASRNFYRVQLGGDLLSAPSIAAGPTNRYALEGQNVSFAVTADGSAPLAFQWLFKGTPVSGATGAVHSVNNVQTDHAGDYRVIVTNSLGSVTSAPATLTIVALPPAGTPDGYATLGAGTTGGAGGPVVTVSTFQDFEFYVGNDSGPFTVLVQGTIHLGGSNVRVRDNKTIIGLGSDAGLIGDLKVDRNNNVIIRNLTFTNPGGAGDKDGLTLQECLNVWVDHCTFVDCSDGSLDISHGADWITVSWCRFHYTDASNEHRFSNLVGHSDNNAAEDAGRLHVTFHHNWWGQLVHERMPRVRFGRVHVFNNFYNSPGNNNCIRAAVGSEILVENNYFDGVKNVWELYRTSGIDGKVFASGNLEVNTTWSAGGDSDSIQVPGTDVLSAEVNGLNPVSYAYTLDSAANVPLAVTNNAGAGKGPFAP